MADVDVPPEISRRLGEVFDFARALAQARLEELDAPDAEIEPFGVAAVGEELKVVLLDDVRGHLATPHGMGRVAGTILQRYGADTFAIAATHHASPDGSAEHPQAREVMRVVVGHANGMSGAMYAAVERGTQGPRLGQVWEVSEG